MQALQIAAFLLAASVLPQKKIATVPTPPRVRPEFLTAAQTVIDDDDMVLVRAGDVIFFRQLDVAKSAQNALGRMASTDLERTIAKLTGAVVFETETCHLSVGISEEAVSDCQLRVFRKRTDAMIQMDSHKEGGYWVSGRPPDPR